MTRHATIRFTDTDQKRFAKLSGDFNPVHLDRVAARRVVAGEPIVHGIHLLLRALDVHFSRTSPPEHVSVTATFLRPAVLEEPIRIESNADGTVSIQADGDIDLVLAKISAPRDAKPPAKGRKRDAVDTGGGRRSEGPAAGTIDLRRTVRPNQTFPRLARALGSDVVAALAGVSNIVGMECPGRDSLLSAVHLELTRHARASRLDWRVARSDDRFGLVRLAIASPAVSGTVDAFRRPQPVALPTIDAATARVVPDEFVGQRALIVGGSRGLGAATAMLLAAGGALPIVTYATGADEAVALRRDAQSAHRSLETLRFDVASDDVKILAEAAARFGVTHLYYYATPRIFARRREPFDDALFTRFAEFYVTAFARVCAAVRGAVASLDVFYPSSIAVEQSVAELTEYAAAKAAGESVCRQMDRPADGLRIVVRRLPRVVTDQTASIVQAPALDPFDAVLPVIRDMQQRVAAASR